MKLLFTLLLFSFSQITFGQTKLIAFKSHSGNMSHFSVEGYDNIGGPIINIHKIELVNDSTIIESFSYGVSDTIVNHPICRIPHLTIDTLKGMYYRNDIEFVGFDTVLTKKEIRRQKRWAKGQVKLKKKRAKLLKKYKDVDEKIVKEINTDFYLMNNDDDFSGGAPLAVSTKNYFTYFSIGIVGLIILMFSIIYFTNKSKVVV